MRIRVVATCLFALHLGMLHAETIEFAIGEWEPYTGQALPAYGAVAEIVSAVCAKEGLAASYTFFPWRRAESKVEQGQYFATFPYQETPERAARFQFSDPVLRSSTALLFHHGNPRTEPLAEPTLPQLKRLKIGVLAGSEAISRPFQDAGAEVDEVQTPEQNLKKLERDRLDAVADDRSVLLFSLRKHGNADPERSAPFRLTDLRPAIPTEYKLLVSTRYPQAARLLERFNTGLKKLRASGEYQRILRKHLP